MKEDAEDPDPEGVMHDLDIAKVALSGKQGIVDVEDLFIC